MQDNKYDLTGTKNNNGIPKFVEERAPTPLGDSVVSLGNKGSPIIALIAV